MVTTCRFRPARFRGIVLSHVARPLRFAGTGGVAGAAQVLLLALLTHHGWPALEANGVAFLLSAQLNFALSVTFTWRDRASTGPLHRRWMLFHASIALMALVNMAVFVVARPLLPLTVASLAGIGVGAVGNFLLGDRVVFRDGSASDSLLGDRQRVA